MRKVVLTPELMHRVEADHRFRTAGAAETYPDWREDALCIAAPDPDLFFPVGPEGIEPARRVCGRCPVTGQCLAEALGRAEIDGVWGGTTSSERRVMRAVWRRSHPLVAAPA